MVFPPWLAAACALFTAPVHAAPDVTRAPRDPFVRVVPPSPPPPARARPSDLRDPFVLAAHRADAPPPAVHTPHEDLRDPFAVAHNTREVAPDDLRDPFPKDAARDEDPCPAAQTETGVTIQRPQALQRPRCAGRSAAPEAPVVLPATEEPSELASAALDRRPLHVEL